MASTERQPPTEARELDLVKKVELRIALAESDQKLEALLGTYLAPLLLKLDSEHSSVRQKVRHESFLLFSVTHTSTGHWCLPASQHSPAVSVHQAPCGGSVKASKN